MINTKGKQKATKRSFRKKKNVKSYLVNKEERKKQVLKAHKPGA